MCQRKWKFRRFVMKLPLSLLHCFLIHSTKILIRAMIYRDKVTLHHWKGCWGYVLSRAVYVGVEYALFKRTDIFWWYNTPSLICSLYLCCTETEERYSGHIADSHICTNTDGSTLPCKVLTRRLRVIFGQEELVIEPVTLLLVDDCSAS